MDLRPFICNFLKLNIETIKRENEGTNQTESPKQEKIVTTAT